MWDLLTSIFFVLRWPANALMGFSMIRKEHRWVPTSPAERLSSSNSVSWMNHILNVCIGKRLFPPSIKGVRHSKCGQDILRFSKALSRNQMRSSVGTQTGLTTTWGSPSMSSPLSSSSEPNRASWKSHSYLFQPHTNPPPPPYSTRHEGCKRDKVC